MRSACIPTSGGCCLAGPRGSPTDYARRQTASSILPARGHARCSGRTLAGAAPQCTARSSFSAIGWPAGAGRCGTGTGGGVARERGSRTGSRAVPTTATSSSSTTATTSTQSLIDATRSKRRPVSCRRYALAAFEWRDSPADLRRAFPLIVETAARALEALVERPGDVGRHGAEPHPLGLGAANVLLGSPPARLFVFRAAAARDRVGGQPLAQLLCEPLGRRHLALGPWRAAGAVQTLLDLRHQLFHPLPGHVGIEVCA